MKSENEVHLPSEAMSSVIRSAFIISTEIREDIIYHIFMHGQIKWRLRVYE